MASMLIVCSNCLEPYTGRQPKLLPCSHTFCLPCLTQLSRVRAAASITCPTCRRVFPVPPGGVTKFQTNFYVVECCRPDPEAVIMGSQSLEKPKDSEKTHDERTVSHSRVQVLRNLIINGPNQTPVCPDDSFDEKMLSVANPSDSDSDFDSRSPSPFREPTFPSSFWHRSSFGHRPRFLGDVIPVDIPDDSSSYLEVVNVGSSDSDSDEDLSPQSRPHNHGFRSARVSQNAPRPTGPIRSGREGLLGPIPMQNAFQPQMNHAPIPKYRMNSYPRGICVIFNNKDFPNSRYSTREGTDRDKELLSDTFRILGFQVDPHDNLTHTEMLAVLTDWSRKDHSTFDCFACCILSHGTLGCVLGTNGHKIPIRELTSQMRALACPTLAGKPKLFFIQACQGVQEDSGHVMMQSDADFEPPEKRIPNESDFLLSHSTVPGYMSYRDPEQGTPYAKALAENLRNYHNVCDILEILTMVNRDVANADFHTETGLKKQSPAPFFTLQKKLVFEAPQPQA